MFVITIEVEAEANEHDMAYDYISKIRWFCDLFKEIKYKFRMKMAAIN